MGQNLDGAEGAVSGGVLEKLIIQIEWEWINNLEVGNIYNIGIGAINKPMWKNIKKKLVGKIIKYIFAIEIKNKDNRKINY